MFKTWRLYPCVSKLVPNRRSESTFSCIDINNNVKHALKNDMPVVALESTIITHGMPHPINIQCALEVEQEILNKVTRKI